MLSRHTDITAPSLSASYKIFLLRTTADIRSFTCPECDKKFVSYYGLVQHYDQHPKLKVTCVLCEITFDSHHLLVEHNKNVHQLDENGLDRDKEKWVFLFYDKNVAYFFRTKN